MDQTSEDHLRMLAAKCRYLARGTDKRTEDALLSLAESYEAEADALKAKPAGNAI